MPAFTARTTQRLRAGSLLLGLALWGGAPGASAEPVDDLGGRLPIESGMKCYSQAFDKAHLAAHPNQRITSIPLVIAPMIVQGHDRYPAWPYLFVTRLKGEKGLFWQGGQCEFDGGEFNCSVDCDGGHVTLAAPEAGPGLHMELRKTFVLQGGCGDRRKVVYLSRIIEEPSYTLEAKDMNVCTSQIRASRKASEALREIGGIR
jgi:hypothetical protein